MVGNWGVSFLGLTLRTWALTLFLSELGLIFLVLPASRMVQVYGHERGMVASQLGEETQKRIDEKSADWFKRAIVDSGVLAGSYSLCLRQGKDRFDDRGLGALFAKRLDVFWLAVRQMFFRFGLLTIWLPCVLVIFLPLVVDACMQRQIRKNQFAPANTLVYHYALVLISLLVIGIILAPLLPVPMAPLGVPLGLAVIGVALWFGLVITQKRT